MCKNIQQIEAISLRWNRKDTGVFGGVMGVVEETGGMEKVMKLYLTKILMKT